MEKIRVPFFVAAFALLLATVLIESGSSALLSFFSRDTSGAAIATSDLIDSGMAFFPAEIQREMKDVLADEDAASEIGAAQVGVPAGFGVRYLLLIDGILLFTVALIGIALIIPDGIQAKIQGIITLIFSMGVIAAAVFMILTALAAVSTMVVLLLAVPFGTIVYLIQYGSFDRNGATVLLGVLMSLKLGFTACLILSHQRFLQGKGLVAIIITAFVASLIVSFLHAFAPSILVSITDAIAGIVVAVIAVLWALFLLFGSLPAIFKAFKPAR